MRYAAVIKLLGVLLMLFSLSMIPPMIVAMIYHELSFYSFVASFFMTLAVGFCLWVPFSRSNVEMKNRDGFLVVVLFWIVLSLFGALPFYLNLFHEIDFTESFFESVSGLTTTGASILSNLDTMPRALLYYRQQLQLLGGMGIIILALAIMPMLGMGGLRLYRAEAVGPFKNDKLKPRLAETAKALWYIYVGLTVICIICYWLAGMTVFDAIGEGFSTVATGGFTMHDQSFAYYHSMPINIIAMVFMLISAFRYSLHFNFIWHRDLSIYFKDPELKAYLKLIAISIVVTMIILFMHHFYKNDYGRVIMQSFFTIISTATTTGLSLTDFVSWPTFLPFLIMFLAIIGGCGGSTAGGIKIVRMLLLKEQGKREMRKLIHPNIVMAIKLGNQVLPENIIQGIWGFFAMYIVLFVVMLLLLLATGVDPTTAFGSLAACISNTGQSIGLTGGGFALLPDSSKWILIFAMIAGRLEIFTLIVLFLPEFWRK
jgi:trk system potassium uptake protein TrkH